MGLRGSKGRQNHHFQCSDALSVFGHFPTEIHLCQRIACLRLAFLNHMAADILRGGNFRMTQHFGDCDHIRSLRNQHRRCRMPECTGIDVRQMTLLSCYGKHRHYRHHNSEICQFNGIPVRGEEHFAFCSAHIDNTFPNTCKKLRLRKKNALWPSN